MVAADKKMNQPPVSGSRQTDRLILKSLELLAAAIRKATALIVALALCVCCAATASAKLGETVPHSQTHPAGSNDRSPCT
jgi:hypothetical protein